MGALDRLCCRHCRDTCNALVVRGNIRITMNRIVIIVEGGVVQAIHSDEDVLIHVVDKDTEGIPDDEIEEYAMDIYDNPRHPDTIGMARAVLKEGVSSMIPEKSDLEKIHTLEQFVKRFGFRRDSNLPSKKRLDEAIAESGIKSDDLIADIYGYFLTDNEN